MYFFASTATELGFVETTPNDTLHSLRPKINQLFANRAVDGHKPSEDSWRFLDGKVHTVTEGPQLCGRRGGVVVLGHDAQ